MIYEFSTSKYELYPYVLLWFKKSEKIYDLTPELEKKEYSRLVEFDESSRFWRRLMASGKNHDRAILLMTPIWSLTAAHYGGLWMGVLVGAAHFLGGWYLSPDLDLKSRPFLRWGVLKSMWLPYQDRIPHRHWLSHAPVIGSVVRLLYLAAWLSPLLLIPSIHRGLLSIGWERLIAGFIGVELSAMNHLILDGLVIPLPLSVRKRLGGN